MSEFLGNKKMSREERIALMKRLLLDMDKGNITPEEIKSRFKTILADMHPVEIAIIENALINDGFPAEKIHNLCDVHIDIFRESIENQAPIAQKGHPIYLFMAEHVALLKLFGKAKTMSKELKEYSSFEEAKNLIDNLKKVALEMKGVESHMLREENVLFPYLEKHEIIQPAKIMWTEHDSLRERIKELLSTLDSPNESYQDFAKHIDSLILYIVDLKSNHIYKENKILYPSAITKLTEDEWNEIWEQMDEMGYASFTPEKAKWHKKVVKNNEVSREEDEVQIKLRELLDAVKKNALGDKVKFEYGELTSEQLKAMMDILPVEITFIDDKDIVRYFNRAENRVFPRTKAVIGRTVQNCHPPKSVHIVEKILSDFKSGKRGNADFWIQMKGKFVYIRYFAVRDEKGKYLGTLEVTQDVTDIRNLQGERRIYAEE
ncbi:MAG: DUF438 domain-containing protein [Caldisericaceae bacterium]|nr:DUF438 domain-containing protein [Caldisericaceae bacterium]